MGTATAKKHLRQMLKHYTSGSVLHLLAEVVAEGDDPVHAEQRQAVEKALLVVGLGVDAVLPHQHPVPRK